MSIMPAEDTEYQRPLRSYPPRAALAHIESSGFQSVGVGYTPPGDGHGQAGAPTGLGGCGLPHFGAATSRVGTVPLCSFARKCATGCVVGLFAELLPCHTLSPGLCTSLPPGSVGDLQLFCRLLYRPGHRVFFMEHCGLASKTPVRGILWDIEIEWL